MAVLIGLFFFGAIVVVIVRKETVLDDEVVASEVHEETVSSLRKKAHEEFFKQKNDHPEDEINLHKEGEIDPVFLIERRKKGGVLTFWTGIAEKGDPE